jgi:phenylpropionate dioxygenase-like ring-hydroxylating dioxygenase large terminal subunit
VQVLLNICRHRGSVVCRDERGNSQFFRCPYHNWVYRNDGALVGIPDHRRNPEGWGDRIGGLMKAPRVSTYRGMIFASFAEAGETLEEDFGPLRKYIDYWFDHSPVGRVTLSQPYRAVYHGNWKFQAENSTDGWHARYVHKSALQMLERFGDRSRAVGWPGCTRGFAHGHGLLEMERNDIPPTVEEAFTEHIDLLTRRYGAEAAEQLYLRRHIAIFPNLHLMEFKFRVIQPVTVDRTIVYKYPVRLEEVPDRINQAIFTRIAKDISVSSGSLVAGMVNADDVEIFSRVQSGLQAAKVPWLYLSRGLQPDERRPTGEVVGERTDEIPQRAFYREWARLMASAAAEEGEDGR